MPKLRRTTSPVKGLNAAAATDRAWTSSPMEVTWGMGSLLPAGAVRATARADTQSPLWHPEPAERSCAAGEATQMAFSYRLDVRFGLSKLTSQLRIGEIACDFLLVCNFAGVLLVSLSSQRVLGRGLIGIVNFLKVGTVMRPCDGTSGLVRGNRRKAVFAFKWSKWINRLYLSTSRLLFLKAVGSNAIKILV